MTVNRSAVSDFLTNRTPGGEGGEVHIFITDPLHCNLAGFGAQLSLHHLLQPGLLCHPPQEHGDGVCGRYNCVGSKMSRVSQNSVQRTIWFWTSARQRSQRTSTLLSAYVGEAVKHQVHGHPHDLWPLLYCHHFTLGIEGRAAALLTQKAEAEQMLRSAVGELLQNEHWEAVYTETDFLWNWHVCVCVVQVRWPMWLLLLGMAVCTSQPCRLQGGWWGLELWH